MGGKIEHKILGTLGWRDQLPQHKIDALIDHLASSRRPKDRTASATYVRPPPVSLPYVGFRAFGYPITCDEPAAAPAVKHQSSQARH